MLEAHTGVLEDLALTTHRTLAPGLAAQPQRNIVEHRPVGFTQGLACAGHGLLEKNLVLGRAPERADVRAVHREMHDQRLQGPSNGAQGQVAAHHVIPGHLQQGLGDTFTVTGQRAVEDLLASQLGLFDKGRRPFAVTLPQLSQGLRALGGVLQQRQLIHEFITGTAIDVPVATQGFAGTEDLLDIEGDVPPGRKCIDPAPELAAVTPWVGEAVNVVDAQAIHQAAGDQLEDLGVGGLEHGRAFDP
ncbi:hypothetical protein D3C84_270990 [compost metagenome]